MPAERSLRDGPAPGYALIETMRHEPGTGLVRGQRHLHRLRRSAAALGFAWPQDDIEAALAGLTELAGPRRVRLELAADGRLEIAAVAFTDLPAGTVWRLAVASCRIDAGDPLIRHKTTRRGVYDAARAEFAPSVADEVVILNADGFLCEGTITNLFLRMDDGPLVTPRLSYGLLPGILREEMLEEGLAVEADLRIEHLADAHSIHVGNSLRGLIEARLP